MSLFLPLLKYVTTAIAIYLLLMDERFGEGTNCYAGF